VGSIVTLRPDQVGDPRQGAPHTLAQWFNTAAFKDVPAGAQRVGNSRATALTGPGFEQWDASIFRNFYITRHSNGQFRVETFNVLNHTNPQGLNASTDVVGSSGFGTVASVREPRRLQLALKLQF
jgi:hypothetical protein